MFAAMFAIAVVYGLNHTGWQDDSDENDSSLCFWLTFLITHFSSGSTRFRIYCKVVAKGSWCLCEFDCNLPIMYKILLL